MPGFTTHVIKSMMGLNTWEHDVSPIEAVGMVRVPVPKFVPKILITPPSVGMTSSVPSTMVSVSNENLRETISPAAEFELIVMVRFCPVPNLGKVVTHDSEIHVVASFLESMRTVIVGSCIPNCEPNIRIRAFDSTTGELYLERADTAMAVKKTTGDGIWTPSHLIFTEDELTAFSLQTTTESEFHFTSGDTNPISTEDDDQEVPNPWPNIVIKMLPVVGAQFNFKLETFVALEYILELKNDVLYLLTDKSML